MQCIYTVPSGCCRLLGLQLAVKTNTYSQKSCVNKKEYNKLLLKKKHDYCVLDGVLKLVLIASLERVCKVNISEKCLADRCSDSQKAVVYMTPSYLLIPLK